MELSGAASSVASAIAVAAVGGRVVLAGSVATTPAVPVDPEDVVRRMLTVTGSHNYAAVDLREAVAFLMRTEHATELAEMTVVGGELASLHRVFSQATEHPRVAVTPN